MLTVVVLPACVVVAAVAWWWRVLTGAMYTGWFYIRSARGGLHLVAAGHIFYEDGGSHPRRVTWRCARSYQKAERCQVALCLRDGRLVYFRGNHNHPPTYNPSKHESRRFEVDPLGKYKIVVCAPPPPAPPAQAPAPPAPPPAMLL
ncbi:hypothetical protein JYU34_004457 [Plutella xylostella]|uniref:FLYWCH-type domain-containing protein n=1 Tax=Plutella xylostella TaxID=51655 RepID=A0ABQ7QY31_PLUXY|nr:hypothetical protein JYU34_004457 [Plutella xylostella]